MGSEGKENSNSGDRRLPHMSVPMESARMKRSSPTALVAVLPFGRESMEDNRLGHVE